MPVGDHERFQNVYFGNYRGYYFTGDSARRDEDGYYWLTGAHIQLLFSFTARRIWFLHSFRRFQHECMLWFVPNKGV